MTRPAVFKFSLYIAGDAMNSAHALTNLQTICREHLPGRHVIDVVDVFRQPKRALSEGIFMTPTLVKSAPGPVRKIVGTLSDATTVLQALGLQSQAS